MVYPASCSQSDFLKYYSQQFPTVEGNTTFYAIPKRETASRWCDQTPDGFRFALKFPRSITHEQKLVAEGPDFDQIIEVLTLISKRDRLGPTMIQLPPRFGSNQFPELVQFLRQLPKAFSFAVEVRHLDYFKEPFESRLNEWLRDQKMDRVIFDSRPLFAKPASEETEKEAMRRKPNLPVSTSTTGNYPILRLIGRNQIEDVDPWIEEWGRLGCRSDQSRQATLCFLPYTRRPFRAIDGPSIPSTGSTTSERNGQPGFDPRSRQAEKHREAEDVILN